MYGRYSIIAGLIVEILPVVIYLLRIRTQVQKLNWSVIISGLLATLCMVFVGGWGSPFGFVMYYIWTIVLPAFIAVHTVIWIIAAVKKSIPCGGAMVMTGIVPIISGVLLNNWVTVGIAIVYLYFVIRSGYEFSRYG